MTDREKVINEIEKGIRLGGHWDETYRMVSLQLLNDILALLKEQEGKIEQLEHDLAVTQNNLNYYVNGND